MSETTKSTTATPTDDEPSAASTAGEGVAATSGGAGPAGGPVPGDPSTEPVATAAQSHVPGRVGPPSIPQDSDAVWHAPDGVEQITPGEERDAATPLVGGPLAVPPVPAELGAGPYGGDTPADDAPNTVKATTPGEGGPTAAELPPNTPLPGDKASASSIGGGNATTAAPGSSPTSSTGEPASPSDESDADESSTKSTSTKSKR
jgi:hypothetical protein